MNKSMLLVMALNSFCLFSNQDFFDQIAQYDEMNFFYGCSGKYRSGGVFHVEHPMTDEDQEYFAKKWGVNHFESMHPADKEIVSQIETMLQAKDEKERFLGLFFAMRFCQDMDFSSIEHDLILKKFLDHVIYDSSDLVKIQIMWILASSQTFNYWMLNQANDLIISNITSDNSSVRLGVLELVERISKERLHYYWMLERFICDTDPLVSAEMILMDYAYSNNHSLLGDVMDSINVALQSEHEQDRHTALYLLTKLQDFKECHEFIEEKLWSAMQDTPWIQMQGLWVMSECACIDKQSARIRALAHQSVQNNDWHIRFGGVILLLVVIRSNDDYRYEEVAKVYDLCKHDDNRFLQFLAE